MILRHAILVVDLGFGDAAQYGGKFWNK